MVVTKFALVEDYYYHDSGEIIGVKQAGVEQQALGWSVAGVPPLVIARIGNYLPTLLCFPCMDNYMLSLNGAS